MHCIINFKKYLLGKLRLFCETNYGTSCLKTIQFMDNSISSEANLDFNLHGSFHILSMINFFGNVLCGTCRGIIQYKWCLTC